MVFLGMVASHLRKARREPDPFIFSLEQPASPREYKPEVVSFWDTPQWTSLKEEFEWEETTFSQRPLGGAATKPTTFGGNLQLTPEDHVLKSMDDRQVTHSWQLARWPPGLMNMVATALLAQAFHQQPKMKALSWEEHLAFGHTPSRRDCKTCQENMQQCNPHRRVPHPLAGVLSLDTAGPLTPATDQGGQLSRYFLAGAFTWAIPKGSNRTTEEEPEAEGEEELPMIEAEREKEEGKGKDEEQGEIQEDQEIPEGHRETISDAEEREGREVGHLQEELSPGGDEALPTKDSHPPKDFEIKTFHLALPMLTKKAMEVTKATMEMVLRLKMDGYTVNRIHTDQGREFSGQFAAYCRRRGIMLTKTAGDEPQANGRAESTVKRVKTMVRKALHQAEKDARWWPWATRYINEILRCHRIYEVPTFPMFMEKILVRKRRWQRDDLGPTMEEVCYLGPSTENHGHWIVKEGERPRLTRCVMKKVEGRPTEGQWIALERELLDGLTLRRRLRGKTTIKKLQKEVESEEEKEKKEKMRVKRVVEEEMLKIHDDDPDLAVCSILVLGKLKKILEEGVEEEEEILQTKIVSPKEVAKEWKKWIPSAEDEVHSLLTEKQALLPLPAQKVTDFMEEARRRGVKVELIPSKLVFARKPGKNGGKLKVRWVICGNFESKQPEETNYSGGADASAFRIMILLAARHQWEGASLDVKTAFLNAEMTFKDDEHLMLVLPPTFFVERGFMEKDTYYLPQKAVYGLRRSPRLWGEHRDEAMRKFEVKVQEEGKDKKMKLKALDSEPNLWKVVFEEDESEEMKGLVMTYVDDLFIVGPQEVTKAIREHVQKTWTTSSPQDVSEVPIKFLGMEVSKEWDHQAERFAWFISQSSYVEDLLSTGEEKLKTRKIPMTRDQASMEPIEEMPSQAQIRSAQKVVGELLWLVTRTRPDLMFSVSRMGANILRSPQAVAEAGIQAKGYLLGTKTLGLKYLLREDEDLVLNVFTDASYAPNAEESHGCCIVVVGSCPIFWKSGRQSTVTLSTAEAELTEVVEGMVAGESISVILDELVGRLPRMAWTDSQSGLSILTSEGGSWRTRHLRLRSAYTRQCLQEGLWGIAHVPGEDMLADIGTKPLTGPRLEDLKKKMNMAKTAKEEEKKDEKDVKPNEEGEKSEEKKGEGKCEREFEEEIQVKKAKTAAILRVLLIAASLTATKAQGEDEREEEATGISFEMIVMIYTMSVILVTMIVWWVAKEGVPGLWYPSRGRSTHPRSLPATPPRTPRKMKALKVKEGEGRSPPRTPEVSRPVGLPEEIPMTPPLTANKMGSKGREGKITKVDGTPYKVPKGWTPPPDWMELSKEEEKEKEEEEEARKALDFRKRIQEMEEEEERNPTASSSTNAGAQGGTPAGGNRLQATPKSGERVPFITPTMYMPPVLTTRFGKAFHCRESCDYLVAPRTGTAKKSPWCPDCTRSIGRRTNWNMWSNSWGGEIHPNKACKRLRSEPLLRYTPCTRCTPYEG